MLSYSCNTSWVSGEAGQAACVRAMQRAECRVSCELPLAGPSSHSRCCTCDFRLLLCQVDIFSVLRAGGLLVLSPLCGPCSKPLLRLPCMGLCVRRGAYVGDYVWHCCQSSCLMFVPLSILKSSARAICQTLPSGVPVPPACLSACVSDCLRGLRRVDACACVLAHARVSLSPFRQNSVSASRGCYW